MKCRVLASETSRAMAAMVAAAAATIAVARNSPQRRGSRLLFCEEEEEAVSFWFGKREVGRNLAAAVNDGGDANERGLARKHSINLKAVTCACNARLRKFK